MSAVKDVVAVQRVFGDSCVIDGTTLSRRRRTGQGGVRAADDGKCHGLVVSDLTTAWVLRWVTIAL